MTAQYRLYALGRLRAGEMNKTERAYAKHLELRVQAGEVEWWKFEGLKFRLADRTTFEPDFSVMLATGQIELHEVKGARAVFRDDARVKIKVAAEQYPFRFIAVYPKRGGGWEFEEF